MGHFWSVLEAKFSKTGQLDNFSEMSYGCIEASTGELRVSENSVASSKHACWFRLALKKTCDKTHPAE